MLSRSDAMLREGNIDEEKTRNALQTIKLALQRKDISSLTQKFYQLETIDQILRIASSTGIYHDLILRILLSLSDSQNPADIEILEAKNVERL
jgi:hypothetical protein